MPRYDMHNNLDIDSESDDEQDRSVVRSQDTSILVFNRIDKIYRTIRNHADDTCIPIGEYTNHTNISTFLNQIDKN